jgi:catechol 2,3-dioxygenase-like lactoylglutathione lyase family enzyme
MIEAISAITLATHDMQRSVRFYAALGFDIIHGGESSSFTSFRTGGGYLNVVAQPPEKRWSWWGRAIFYVSDVDAMYRRALAAGFEPSTTPRDAEWGERYFHLTDPDGHELSFARPLQQAT